MRNESQLIPLKKYIHEHEQFEKYHFTEEQLMYTAVKVIEGPLFFGHVPDFQERLMRLKHMKTIVFCFEHVPYMDEAGLYAFKEIIIEFKSRGIDINLTGMQKQPHAMMKLIGLYPRVLKASDFFKNVDDCLECLALGNKIQAPSILEKINNKAGK